MVCVFGSESWVYIGLSRVAVPVSVDRREIVLIKAKRVQWVEWMCVGCALGMRWVCDGCAMGVRWVCDGCAVGVRWVCGGCAMGLVGVRWVWGSYAVVALGVDMYYWLDLGVAQLTQFTQKAHRPPRRSDQRFPSRIEMHPCNRPAKVESLEAAECLARDVRR